MSVTLGPKLGLLINADIGDTYGDQFRVFLRFFDAIIQGGVISSSITTPPTTPSNGDAYLLLGSPTGAWSGEANSIAVWSTEITGAGNNIKTPGWEFWTPNDGWTIWDASLATSWIFTQGSWVAATQTRAPFNLVVSSPTTNFNFATSLTQKTVLEADTTITFSGANQGDRVIVILQQDGNGNHAVTWGANIGGASTTGQSAGLSTTFEFVYDGMQYLLVNDPIANQ